jgi:hypothetical protein
MPVIKARKDLLPSADEFSPGIIAHVGSFSQRPYDLIVRIPRRSQPLTGLGLTEANGQREWTGWQVFGYYQLQLSEKQTPNQSPRPRAATKCVDPIVAHDLAAAIPWLSPPSVLSTGLCAIRDGSVWPTLWGGVQKQA